jgi:hypothetical protein
MNSYVAPFDEITVLKFPVATIANTVVCETVHDYTNNTRRRRERLLYYITRHSGGHDDDEYNSGHNDSEHNSGHDNGGNAYRRAYQSRQGDIPLS